uniref:hypothetical protein RF1 n=1 Tax=Urtica atrichocaulis TaxID=1399757 RepID=UPI002113D01F|nr:hypothetical protein RF1 [Urtica atrichocaulis]USG54973.1 hypothetical protein RF1 [Urtica atrichocaulis]
MIFQSFILGNLVSLCMKIINSVVAVGLYYGFLTTFSIGPSYLLLLRARVMEEGTEKKVSATIGFITGQLMMFISIYYVPLHLALDRPHTITVLALPYLLFHFFWNNHKHFFYYRSTNRNSMRNLSIQCVFLNNLIFQLFNHFILPSSMLVRLVNIYMFRCNNKMLFVTSSFVGWLIGHILFMKWVGLVLVWIQQNNSIRSNKYLVSELRNFVARIFSILLFITCVYYLGRIPSPILTKKLKETSERGESEEETEIETTSETKGTKQEQEGSTEEDPSPSLFWEEKEDPYKIDEREEIRVNGKEKTKDEFLLKETQYKNRPVYETYYLNVDRNQENSKLEIFKEKKKLHNFRFQKPFVTILFNYKKWNRPFRSIKTYKLKESISITLKNEMSQYFFHACQSVGKDKICFTHPPSLSTFFEMIERKLSIFIKEKRPFNELENLWRYNNKEKIKNKTNKFIYIVKNIDKILGSNSPILDRLENRHRLCKYCNNKKNIYLPEVYDPFLKGASRGQMLKLFWLSIKYKNSIQNYIERGWINKLFGVFLIINYLEFQQEQKKIDRIKKKSLEKEISFLVNFINDFFKKRTSNFKKNINFFEYKRVRINSTERKKKIIFENVHTNSNGKKIRKNLIELNEIIKKVPRWSYRLINNLEQYEEQNTDLLGKHPTIRSRKSKRIVILNDDLKDSNTSSNPQDLNNDRIDKISLIRYSQQPDFRRNLITGSIRAQRRKTIICKSFEANTNSPTFLDRMEKELSFNIYEPIKEKIKNFIWKNKEFNIIYCTEKKENESTKKKAANKRKEEKRKRTEKTRIKIAETWDRYVIAQIIRSLVLLSQSILRKYIILPSLIIVKNITRILFFKFPEWSEDFMEWRKEMHVKCTYSAVPLSEKEFPKNWLTQGLQIKILFPFHLKIWNKSKLLERKTYPLKNKEKKTDFFFLTVWGMETELPFGSPRKQLSFFEPIFKELKKKCKKSFFRIIQILKERILFLKKKKRLPKIKKIPLFRLKEISKSSENKNEQNFIQNNEIIEESGINIQSTNSTALTKQKIQGLVPRTSTIINEIQKVSNDNKKEFRSLHINNSLNKKNFDKRLESPKTFLKLLKKRNVRLISKTTYFINFLLERIHRNILIYIKNIYKEIVHLFFLKQQKKITKYICYTNYIYNNETNQEKFDKTNKRITLFIYTITKALSNMSNKRLQSFYDLSSLSQAYVFYKLSQNAFLKFFNLYQVRLRFVFQSNGNSLFLKNEIKNYFIRTYEIFHSESNHKNLRNFRPIYQCKNRLKDYYQEDLSQFISQENLNKVNHHSIKKNNKLINFKKQYKYNLFSYNFIKYEDKRNSSISLLSLQVNNNQYIFYNYAESKRQSFNILAGILVQNYKAEDNIIHIKKNRNRKIFHWIFLNFCFIKNIGTQVCKNMDTDTDSNKYTKIRTNNYKTKKIYKIENKFSFFPTGYQNQGSGPYNNNKKLFDWMRMNEEILNCSIFNLPFWFFPEFLVLSFSYKIKPIPIKLLLLNFNANVSKNTTVKKKMDIFLSIFSLKKKNQREKECIVQPNFESTLVNYEKYIEKNYMISKLKKEKKKREYKNNMGAKLDFVLKRYLLFQLRWNNFLNQKIINNINVYCLLLRLLNPREIAIASIQKREISLDILKIHKNLILSKLLKKRILLIEPLRLCLKRAGHFIMQQTIGISVVYNSNHAINQRSRKKVHVDKKNYDDLIRKPQKMVEKRDNTYFELLVPESILSPRRRREFRILICFDSINQKVPPINALFWTENRVKSLALNKRKRETNTQIKFKFFIWPNYRLEDFACMNRYWFDTNNSSRFGLLRIHMYPQFEK